MRGVPTADLAWEVGGRCYRERRGAEKLDDGDGSLWPSGGVGLGGRGVLNLLGVSGSAGEEEDRLRDLEVNGVKNGVAPDSL